MEELSVFFVSDHTGVTAEAVGRSLLSQFRGLHYKTLTVPFVDTPEKVQGVMQRVRETAPALIISTLTDPAVRAALRQCDAPVFDVFEAFSEPLANFLGVPPAATAGQTHGMSHSYDTRMDAVNFTLAVDDGLNPQRLGEADLILVGVSRAGKTPVSLYLDSPYQISKIVGEYYSNYYLGRHGLPVVKARFQNVYGPGEVLGAGQWRGTVNTVWRNVTPTFIYKAIKGEALPVENGGVASRDLIHVDDIVAGLIACAERGEAGGVFNLASGEETTILELAELINELTGNGTEIALTPARDWDHSGKRFGDPAKAKADLGFEAQVGLRDGLEGTVAWTRENLDWIERCIARHADRMPAPTGAGA